MKEKFWRKALAAALALVIMSGATPVTDLAKMAGSYDFYNKTGNKNTGSITVNDGIVNANGKKSAVGIGGSRGSSDDDGGYGINLTFNDGKVR